MKRKGSGNAAETQATGSERSRKSGDERNRKAVEGQGQGSSGKSRKGGENASDGQWKVKRKALSHLQQQRRALEHVPLRQLHRLQQNRGERR